MIAFLDSSALIALLHKKDELHLQVKSYFSGYRDRIITTEWIMIETLNHLSHPQTRVSARQAIEVLRAQKHYEIIPLENFWYQAGLALYKSRPDKAWSLTDCISFEVMRQRGLYEALTADHHFRQAGFHPVFAA